MSLADDLKNIVKGEVRSDDKTLGDFSEDASIFNLRPEVVVAPEGVEDLKALVRYVNGHNVNKSPEESIYELGREHLSLTARAAGTCMSGGPLSESIVLDFMPHFQGIKHIDHVNKEAVVLPGTYYRDFEDAAAEHNLLLPSYTASKSLNTIGGMVANNSGGEKTLVYGKTADYVSELKMVLSDGEEHNIKAMNWDELSARMGKSDFLGTAYKRLYHLLEDNKELLKSVKPRVSKNSAGYALWDVWDGTTFDPTRLFTGSQGTLGLVTETTLKLVEPKKYNTLLVVFLKEPTYLGDLVNKVLQYSPESFESYDDKTMKFAIRFLPSLIRHMGVNNLLSMGIKFLPELWMVLSGGAPKLVLVAEFTGNTQEEADNKARMAEDNLSEFKERFGTKTHLTKSDNEEDKYWAMRRQSFKLLREHSHGKHTAPFIDDIVVHPADLPRFLPQLTAIMSKYDLLYTIAGHIGDANFHIIPLMDYKRPDFKEIIDNLSREVYDLVLEFDGSITGEHNDGLVRTPYLEQMFGSEVVALFREVKKIFDPHNIFNPGKKVPLDGAVKDYAFDHIKKD